MRLRGLLARLEGARDGAVDDRVLEEILGDLSQGVIPLSGKALAQPVADGLVFHAANATVLSLDPRPCAPHLTLD